MRLSARTFAAITAIFIAPAALCAQEAKTFTLQQILSASYATSLTAAPVGNLFAWVEDSEGRHNLFIGGPHQPARQLTHFTGDDGRDITGVAWSPHATALAFTYGTENGADGKPANPAHLQEDMAAQIKIVSISTGTEDWTMKGHSPIFSPSGDTLFWIDQGKIWERYLEGDPPPPPPDKPLVYDRGSASQLTVSPDGTLLAFISRRSEEGEPSHSFLALFDLRTHTLTFPAPSTANDSAPAFSPDGKSLAWLRAPFTQAPEFANPRTSPNPWSIQLLDLTTRHTRTAFSPEPNKPGSVLPHLSTGEPQLFFAAANHLIFLSEADGWVHLYSLDPASPKPPYLLTHGDFEVEDPAFDPKTSRLVFSANFDGYNKQDRDRRHIMSYLLPDSSTEALGMEQGTSGAGIETHPVIGAGQIAALVSTANRPMHAALIDSRGKIAPLHPEATPADYPATSLVTPQQVLFDSTDGEHLHSQLFLPKVLDPKTKHPAILFVHGGPNRQMLLGYPSMDYYSNAYAMNQYLTSRGFIVLSLNYRCGIGYGTAFRDCLHAGADGATEYNDVLAAAKYLRSRPDVDTAHIGIWGGSYGGYLTALALARNSDLFAAGVDFHGVHDWNLEDNASDWRIGTYAQRDAIAAKALASSPLADLSHWSSPILLIHGDNDPDVAYAQTPTLADALRARNANLPVKTQVDVEELIFPDELHGFLLHKDWLAAYTAAAAFFERTLKPTP
jgi:dipeptidyl aminopeptidase/acylaminoacyl peptidase